MKKKILGALAGLFLSSNLCAGSTGLAGSAGVDVDSLYAQGIAARNEKNMAEAKGIFTQVVEVSQGKHAHALHNLGMIAHNEGNFRGAQQFFTQAEAEGFLPSHNNLLRMMVAKKINATPSQRFLALCELNNYELPVPKKGFEFSVSGCNVATVGCVGGILSLHAENSLSNFGLFKGVDVVWVENPAGVKRLGDCSGVKLLIVGAQIMNYKGMN